MELRNINTFLHVAELHSFSRAARDLGYSQSAVSSQIALLEDELGVPLFDRVGKTVCLTDAGQVFLRYARTLLTTAQQAKAALQPTPEARGSLRVAIADSLCSALMPGLLMIFSRAMEKTRHRSFIPKIDRWGKLTLKLRYVGVPIFAVCLIGHCDASEPSCNQSFFRLGDGRSMAFGERWIGANKFVGCYSFAAFPVINLFLDVETVVA